jgi:CRP-like cAMP-binding protein
MADRFILSQVRRLPMFSALDMAQSEAVANAMQVLRYEPGEDLLRQGQPSPGMFLFVSGSGLLFQRGPDGAELPFGKVSANEYTGETALFSEQISPLTLRAAETVVTLFLSRQNMLKVLSFYPDVKARLLSPGSVPLTAQSDKAKQFEDQRENETILLETRRHWWAVAGAMVRAALLIILSWVLCAILVSFMPSASALMLIPLPISALLLLYLAYHYAEWRNDRLLITDRRVVNIQKNFLTFALKRNELPLAGVHEVNVTLPSDVVGRMMGYGTIIIKTSGDVNNLRIEEIPEPQNIQKMIFNSAKAFRDSRAREQQDENRNAIRTELNQLLGYAPDAPALEATMNVTHAAPAPGFFSLKFINEKGETVYRKHHSVWFLHIFLPALLILGGFIVLMLGVIGFFLPVVIMALGAGWFYLMDWDWRNDLYIVGDQTITLIRKRPLWMQDQKDQVLISQVDNVLSSTTGFMNSLMQVGEVRIMLSGADEKNAKRITNVYRPQEIQQEISRRQDRAQDQKRQNAANDQRKTILEYLSVYHDTLAPQIPGISQPATGIPQAPSPNPFAGSPGVVGPSALNAAPEPPAVPRRDRSRPPGIPRARRDVPPVGG